MLSSTEIKKLYDHVEKHKVVFVDVQIELVDHLASEIESIQKENPSINFETALSRASEKFREASYGIKPLIGKTKYTQGFKGLIDQKSFIATKYLNRRMNDYLLSFFKLPRIIVTLSIWITIYKLIEFGEIKIVGYSVLTIHCIALVYWIFRTQLFQRAHGKFICFTLQSVSLILFLPLYQCYFIVVFINWLDNSTIYFPFMVSSIFSFWLLSIYIGLIYFTDLLISEIKEKYGDHYLNLV